MMSTSTGGGRSDSNGGRHKMKTAEKEHKFHPHGSGRNIASFTQTLNEVILYIQKSWDGGKDIAETLERRKKVDMASYKPKRGEFNEEDEKTRMFEQESLDMAYREEYKRYLVRSDVYEKNLPKALPHGQWYKETGIEHFRNINQNNDSDEASVESEVSERSSQSHGQRVSWSD